MIGKPLNTRPVTRRQINASIPLVAATLVSGIALTGAPVSVQHVVAASQDDATPAANTIQSDVFAKLPAIIERSMAGSSTPGAVVLFRTPNQEYLQAFGTRGIGSANPITIDDHFRIGSNTKTLTGTVLLQRVSEGLISLDDAVSTFRSDVPNGENIKFSQILDMSSGPYDHSDTLAFNQLLVDEKQKVWQPEELLALGLAGPPYFAPGDGFHYSNTNTILVALIVEQLTGQA